MFDIPQKTHALESVFLGQNEFISVTQTFYYVGLLTFAMSTHSRLSLEFHFRASVTYWIIYKVWDISQSLTYLQNTIRYAFTRIARSTTRFVRRIRHKSVQLRIWFVLEYLSFGRAWCVCFLKIPIRFANLDDISIFPVSYDELLGHLATPLSS